MPGTQMMRFSLISDGASQKWVRPGTQWGCVRKGGWVVRKLSMGLTGQDTCCQNSVASESTDTLVVANRDAFLPKHPLFCSSWLLDSWLSCLKTWELCNFSPHLFPFPQSCSSCSCPLYLSTLKTLTTITKVFNFFLYLNNLLCAGYFLL